nr:hypothetical protein [Mycobacterium sp. E3298]
MNKLLREDRILRSKIYQKVATEQFYLGYRPYGHWYSSELPELDLLDLSNSRGEIVSRFIDEYWEVIDETENFIRELNRGEYIKINEENFEILKSSHESDGTVNYYIAKARFVEDKESKKKASDDYEKRRLILDERKRIENESKTAEEVKKDNNDVQPAKSKQRWYQFWK